MIKYIPLMLFFIHLLLLLLEIKKASVKRKPF